MIYILFVLFTVFLIKLFLMSMDKDEVERDRDYYKRIVYLLQKDRDQHGNYSFETTRTKHTQGGWKEEPCTASASFDELVNPDVPLQCDIMNSCADKHYWDVWDTVYMVLLTFCATASVMICVMKMPQRLDSLSPAWYTVIHTVEHTWRILVALWHVGDK